MKLKNKYKLLAYILLIQFVFAGCTKDDEFYTLEKPQVFPYTNVDKLELAAVSMYAKCGVGSWLWQNNMATFIAMNISAGDDARWLRLYTSNVDHVHEYYRTAGDVANSDASILWQGAYSSIGNINTVLDFYEENDGFPFNPNKVITEEYQKKALRVKGEGLFLRAYNYSMLAPMFSPWYIPGGANDDKILPLRTSYPASYDESQPTLASTGEIYDLMVSDLTEAISLLPKIYDDSYSPLTQVARANKYVAYGQLARTYFRMGKYDDALIQLDAILDDPDLPYNLSKDPVTSWNQTELITTTNAPNVMWNQPNFAADNANGWWVMSTWIPKYAWGPDVPWKEYTLSHAMAKKFGWMNDDLSENPEALKDKRYTKLCIRFEPQPSPDEEKDFSKLYEPVYTRDQVSTPEIWIDKYFHTPGYSERMSIPLMKLSEMYLTRSILRFNKGNTNGALEDLNKVRNYAGIGDLPGGVGSLTAEVIHIERAKEMLWEGDRYMYLKALGLDVPPGDRDTQDATQTNNTEKFPYNFYWPVPKNETDYYTE